MRRVIIESPYAGEVARNKLYLNRAIKDSLLSHSESPFASHKQFTDSLDDLQEDDRDRGLYAGYAWMMLADCVVFYIDYGWSPGMKRALLMAQALGKPTVARRIGENAPGEEK